MARTVVGLDVGTSGIRVVEAKVTGKGLQVVRHGSVPLPADAVSEGVVKDPAVVSAAIRQLWDEAKISTDEVHLALGSTAILARQLDLDWMPDADLRKSLRYQVGDQLPVPVDDANLDHVFLGEHEIVDPATGASRRVVRILLIAIPSQVVDDLVRCVQSAKLRPVRADLGALALVRAAASTATDTTPTAEAIIDIGVDKVTVATHTAGRPHSIRVLPQTGSAVFTRALMEQTGRTWLDAERTKCASRIPAPGESPMNLEEATLLSASSRLLGQLRDVFDFHATTDPTNRPTRVLVAGSGAALPGLLEHLSATLGIPTARFDGTRGVEPKVPHGATGEQGQTTDLVQALGLCLEVTA